MGIYDAATAQASRMISKYGQSCTWNTPQAATLDSSKPWKLADGAPLQYPATIAFFPMGTAPMGYAMRGNSVQKGIASAPEVESGEMLGYMAPSSFIPALDDFVTRSFNGQTETLRILAIDVIAPGGVPVLYTVTFAK